MAKSSTPRTGTVSDRLVDAFLRTLIAGALALPYGTRVRLFGALASGVIAPLTRFRKRIDDNLAYVMPELSREERRRIGRASANGAGRLLIENYSGRDLARRMADVKPTGPGLQTLAEARETGRPVLLLTGHFGNYEAARACLIAQGYTIGGLYRPLANPYFNAHYVETMESIGGPVFPQGREGTKGLLTFLRAGGMAMMLNDLYVGSGVEMDFLGKPAMTATSAADIALRLGAALIPVYGIRQPDGLGFAVHVEAEIAHGDPVAMTEAYNASMAARIRAHPGQWFWLHRRWKRKWRGGAGADPDLPAAARPSRMIRR